MIGLLDTSVVVDLLREYQPAKLWLGTQMQLGVTPAVWIEVLEGAPNKRKQQAAVKLLSHFDLIEMNPDDFVWATQALIKYGLSHNVDGYDCLIAAVSYRLNLPLYNRNMKHFAPILASLAVKPY